MAGGIVGPGVSSLYQQYKSDTDKIHTWIGQTAVQHGFPRARLSEYASRSTTPQLPAQGVDAVQAALGKVTLAQDNTSPTPLRYQIPTHMHLELAKYIAEQEIVIPREVSLLLDRCIRARERCAKRIRKYGQVADQGHDFFISVLMTTRSLFEPHFQRSQPKVQGPASVSTTNRFKDLPKPKKDLLKPKKEVLEDIADVQLPETSPATRDSFIVEMSRDEAQVRLFAFFEDIAGVREHLKAVWRAYRAGEVNLVTASVVTNTAIQLLEEPHQHVTQHLLPILGGLSDALASLWRAMQRDGGAVPDKTSMSIMSPDDQGWSTIDHLLLHDYCSLLEMAETCQYQMSNPLSAPFIVTTNSDAGHTKWNAGHPNFGNAHAMYDLVDIVCIPDEQRGSERAKRMRECDRSARHLGYSLMARKSAEDPHKVDIMTMLSQRILLDMMDVLGTDHNLARNELMRAIDRYEGTLRAFVNSLKERADTDARRAIKLNELVRLAKDIEDWKFAAFIDQSRTEAVRNPEISNLLRFNAHLCGSLLAFITTRFRDMGMRLANETGSIYAAATLYTASRDFIVFPPSPPPMPSWPDMQLVLDMHERGNVMPALKPSSIYDPVRELLSYIGVERKDIQALMRILKEIGLKTPKKESNGGRWEYDKGEGSPLRDPSLLVRYFTAAYQTYSTLPALHTDDIQRIFDEVKAKIDRLAHGSHPDALSAKAKCPTPSAISGLAALRRPKDHRSNKFSIIQLLSVVEFAFQHEGQSLHFDYLGFLIDCRDMLAKVALIVNQPPLPHIPISVETRYFMTVLNAAARQGDAELVINVIACYADASAELVKQGVRNAGLIRASFGNLLDDCSQPLRLLLEQQKDKYSSKLATAIKPAADLSERQSVSASQTRYAKCMYPVQDRVTVY